MRRAALTPYAGGRLGLVIVEGDAAPYRVLLARAFDVGTLVDLPPSAASRRHEKTRQITDEDIDRLGDIVLALLLEHGVEHVTMETSTARGVFAEHERKIGEALRLAAGDLGLPFDLATRVPADLAKLRASLVPWPPADDVSAVRGAAALLLAEGSPAVAIKANVSPAAAPPRERRPELVRLPPSPTPPPDLPPGPRRMEIDPGSAHVGVVIAIGDAAPLHLAYAATHHVDSKEWSAIDALASELAALALSYGVQSADVERAKHLYLPPDDGAAGGAARGTRLLRSAEVGASVAANLRAVGVKVSRPSAAEWRSSLVERAIKGEARTNAIGVAVREGFPSWPAADDDPHLRDAAGMALAAVRPPRPSRGPLRAHEPRPPREPREPTPRGKRDRSGRRRPGRERDQERKRQAKEAGGCICKTRPRLDCPYHYPKPPVL